jgi:hypothetical protein
VKNEIEHRAAPTDNGAARSTVLPPLLLTARQAAELCGVSEATWWRLHAAAKCPAPVKIGSSRRVPTVKLSAKVVRFNRQEVLSELRDLAKQQEANFAL